MTTLSLSKRNDIQTSSTESDIPNTNTVPIRTSTSSNFLLVVRLVFISGDLLDVVLKIEKVQNSFTIEKEYLCQITV